MATVQNLGDPGRGVDKRIAGKHADRPFEPNSMPALLLTTGASTATALPRNPRGGDDCVRMFNSGSVPVRVKFGVDNTVVATATDKAIAPGSVEIFSFGPNAQWIATFSATAGTLEVNCGYGM